MLKLNTTAYGTTSIGVLIDALERCNADATVQYDFCYLSPTTVDSYRGYYDHLALGWEATDAPKYNGKYWPTVAMLLDVLRPAIGQTFEGYKGGEYHMDTSTPLWVANYGQTGDIGIVGINADEHTVVLITGKVD